jgi:hypothetical protein
MSLSHGGPFWFPDYHWAYSMLLCMSHLKDNQDPSILPLRLVCVLLNTPFLLVYNRLRKLGNCICFWRTRTIGLRLLFFLSRPEVVSTDWCETQGVNCSSHSHCLFFIFTTIPSEDHLARFLMKLSGCLNIFPCYSAVLGWTGPSPNTSLSPNTLADLHWVI